MLKDDEGKEVQDNEVQGNENQEVEVEPTQQLPKDWRFIPHHPKDLVIGEVSKGVTVALNFMIFVGTMLLFLMLNPRTSSKPRPIHIGC